MHRDTKLDSIDNFGLISGLMEQYAETGDAVAGLRWALPRVLESLSAEAGSLFLHRAEEQILECVVCIGPVDVTGLKVPQEKGLVGRAFTEGTAELVADASKDKAHYKTADSASGFVTISTATAPVQLGDKCYGAIQAINRKTGDNLGNFAQADLRLLETLAGALALALSNVELAQQAINDRLLQRDLDQAMEAQASLLPPPEPDGCAAGEVIPARQLSGDFFDHVTIEDSIAFCQGDVAGKGITASLMMARSIALFRQLARRGLSAAEIAITINQEFLEVPSDRFVTFAVGWMDKQTGDCSFVNCGHGSLVLVSAGEDAAEEFDAQAVPLGLAPIDAAEIPEIKRNLKGKYLILTTDGITEATANGRELGLGGLVSLARRLSGHTALDKIAGLMRLFRSGKLETHDDATMLVITSPEAGI